MIRRSLPGWTHSKKRYGTTTSILPSKPLSMGLMRSSSTMSDFLTQWASNSRRQIPRQTGLKRSPDFSRKQEEGLCLTMSFLPLTSLVMSVGTSTILPLARGSKTLLLLLTTSLRCFTHQAFSLEYPAIEPRARPRGRSCIFLSNEPEREQAYRGCALDHGPRR